MEFFEASFRKSNIWNFLVLLSSVWLFLRNIGDFGNLVENIGGYVPNIGGLEPFLTEDQLTKRST